MKLTRGHGKIEGQEGCIMDFAVWRLSKGTVWADSHPCFNAGITRVAKVVNDRLAPAGLERLDRDFSERVFRARAAGDDETERRINRRLALWAARDCEHLSDDPRVRACNDVTERFLAGEATDDELAGAGAAWMPGTAASKAALAASGAWTAGGDDALLAFFDRLLDAWEKIAADEGALGAFREFEGSQTGGS